MKGGIRIFKSVLLTPYSAAVLSDIKTAVIADLHIGMEESGMIGTRLQTAEMARNAREMMAKYNIRKIVLDGDLKYSFGKMARQEWDELEKFVDAVKGLGEVVAVKGNHDFYLQSMLHGAEITDILEQGRYVITHGNLKIRPRKGKLMIIGNEHPTVKIRDELGALHEYPAYIFCKKEGVLVIPAFNPLTRGANILGNRRWLSPVLAECDVENAEIYAIADDEVVPLGRLKRLEAAARQLI